MRIADLALRLLGATSGEQIIKTAAAASGAITLPAGTTDFSGTGGASQVVRQSTAGGPFTVGQLAAADVTGAITGNQTITLSGDVTGSGTTTITTNLAAGSVALADMQNRAASTLLGNPTGSAAAPSEITLGTNLSFAGTVLNAASGASGLSGMTAGQIPIAATATTITSSGNLSGAVTTSGSLATTLAANAVATTHITNANVTYAKIQNVAASRVLGNPTGSAAAPSEISLGTGLAFAGTVLNGAVGTLTGITAGTGLTGGGTTGTPTVSLSTPVSVVNGGTGLASGTSGGVPYYSATGTIASSALLAAGQVVVGGGAGTTPATIANGQLPATTTNDNAAAGKVGEAVSSVIGSGSPVTLTNSVAANMTSLSLTAGDWDVTGNPVMGTTGTATYTEAAISTTSLSIPDPSATTAWCGFPHGGYVAFMVGPVRISLASTTSVYLTAKATFSSGTANIYGALRARRVR